jgi:uncharacterized membrane protein
MNAESEAAARLERKRRHAFYLVGSAFAAAGITMGTMPVFVAVTPTLAAKGCALFGALILATGRFAPDHILRKLWSPRRE